MPGRIKELAARNQHNLSARPTGPLPGRRHTLVVTAYEF